MERYNVVIIGGGVAGALVAYKLLKKLDMKSELGPKLTILVLEAGPDLLKETTSMPPDIDERLLGVKAFSLDPTQGIGSPYNARNNTLAPTAESDASWYDQDKEAPFRATYERRWGGTTWHWMGLTPRLIPSDFKMRSLYGLAVDWPLSYSDIEPWYTMAEAELGVAGDHAQWDGVHGAFRSAPFPMSEIWPAYSDELVRPRFDGVTFEGAEVKLRTTPQARNSRPYQDRPACAGSSSCIPLCPIGAKYDATVHIRKIRPDTRVTLRGSSIVTRLDADASGRITHVDYADKDKAIHRVAADVVVVAGNAIETPRLLLWSGLCQKSGQLGRNLMDHLNRASYIEASQPVWGYRGPPTTSGIDAFRDGPFRRERAAFRVSVGTDGGGRSRSPQVELASLLKSHSDPGLSGALHGSALRDALRERMSRLFRLSCLGEVLPSEANRVTLSKEPDYLDVPKPHLRFDPGEYAFSGISRADAILRALLVRIGDPSSLSAAEDPLQWTPAGHILGTARMGFSSADGVVDRDGRSFEHPNLFLADGSVFPTQGTANPTLTIAALALRLGSTLARDVLPGHLRAPVVGGVA
jgi:choline dehydrogenase-like flavoprotein